MDVDQFMEQLPKMCPYERRRIENQRKYGKNYRKVQQRAKRYGLSIDQMNDLLDRGCEICGSFERLHIDHDHVSGEVRGCLCARCNHMMAALDTPGWLDKAKVYLAKE